MRQAQESDSTSLLVTRLMNDLEPALLDFIKTNVNSFIKWDLLRLFDENGNTIDTTENIARYVGRTASAIEQELDELVDSGIMLKSGLDGGSAYSLMSDEATAALISKFVSECEDRDFRIKVVYHIIWTDPV